MGVKKNSLHWLDFRKQHAFQICKTTQISFYEKTSFSQKVGEKIWHQNQERRQEKEMKHGKHMMKEKEMKKMMNGKGKKAKRGKKKRT